MNAKNTNITDKMDQIASGKTNSIDLLMKNGDKTIQDLQNHKMTALARIYEYEFNPILASQLKITGNKELQIIKAQLENDFIVYYENKFQDATALSELPENSKDFIEWFKKLIRNHSSYSHKLYTEYLSKQASLEDMRFYLAQESTLDPRFDDLIALMQIGLPAKIKMELANNYWDEMGNGSINDMHSNMFAKVFKYFNITTEYIDKKILPSARISGNLSSILTLHRQNFAKAIGYFGVTEYCVPFRFKFFIQGCERLKINKEVYVYHTLHETIDAMHAHGWFTNVIVPLIKKDTSYAREIAIGALLRLNSSQLYLDELYNKFNAK